MKRMPIVMPRIFCGTVRLSTGNHSDQEQITLDNAMVWAGLSMMIGIFFGISHVLANMYSERECAHRLRVAEWQKAGN
jgi:hypothetical protein